jgi:pyruvate-formate lyase-activating enzyme
MKCGLAEKGYKKGGCEVEVEGKKIPACQATLRKNKSWERVITSAHLSRPEDYFSIYQSGCNHSCLKCHSSRFTQFVEGYWLSTDGIASLAKDYELLVTVSEPRKRATMYHATDLCHHCGSCVLGKRSPVCPGKLSPEQILPSPQGWGPARNIVAFTGGDLSCRAEFYAEATGKIKDATNLWVLLETNGYGLVKENLELLSSSGLDSFWLDIKAYDENVYRKLCGCSNENVLHAPELIIDEGFVLEVLTLYIPAWVEEDQIGKIAELLSELDPEIPFTILAFFPSYKLSESRSPTPVEIVRAYLRAKEAGLKNIKIGNCGVVAKTKEEWDFLFSAVGRDAIG